MTKEEYRRHWCGIIGSVFLAELNVNAFDKVKNDEITPDEYLGLLADEIISNTPEDELEKILSDETFDEDEV